MKSAANRYQSATERDTELRLAAMKRVAARAKNNPAYARKLLFGTGMYTKTGKLKKQFRCPDGRDRVAIAADPQPSCRLPFTPLAI